RLHHGELVQIGVEQAFDNAGHGWVFSGIGANAPMVATDALPGLTRIDRRAHAPLVEMGPKVIERQPSHARHGATRQIHSTRPSCGRLSPMRSATPQLGKSHFRWETAA
ncbi:MAG: hypothetical protein LBU72_06440, partial [Burkholderiaceae bacterium]|nr:hypothetical protein [Burkholderiaceae bacterium]